MALNNWALFLLTHSMTLKSTVVRENPSASARGPTTVKVHLSEFLSNMVYLLLSVVYKINRNEKRVNKQCLLDTPRRVTVNNKRLIYQNAKSQRKNIHIQKLWLKNYKGK